MKMKRMMLGIFTLLGVMLGFASCDKNSNSENTPNDKLEVKVEGYVLEADGTLSPYATNLRAVYGDQSKGTVTGDGEFNYNDPVELTVTAKDPYTLYELYEKSEKGGFTKANGKVVGNSKTLNFNVTEDMYFIAVFASSDDSLKGYKDLTVDGKSSDFTYNIQANADNYLENHSKDMTTIGKEVSAVKTADGVITGWNVTNDQFKAWSIVGPTPATDWLTVTHDSSNGVMTLNAKPFNVKSPARTTIVKVGKDGTGEGAPSSWVAVTVTQNSYFIDVDAPADDETKIVFADGSIANIPLTLDVIYSPNGEVKDFTELNKVFKDKIYIITPVYINGELAPESDWVKKEVVVEFGDPSSSWLHKNDTSYTAGVNNSSAERTADVVVSFKVDGRVKKATTVTAKQDKKKYKVDVEIQG